MTHWQMPHIYNGIQSTSASHTFTMGTHSFQSTSVSHLQWPTKAIHLQWPPKHIRLTFTMGTHSFQSTSLSHLQWPPQAIHHLQWLPKHIRLTPTPRSSTDSQFATTVNKHITSRVDQICIYAPYMTVY